MGCSQVLGFPYKTWQKTWNSEVKDLTSCGIPWREAWRLDNYFYFRRRRDERRGCGISLRLCGIPSGPCCCLLTYVGGKSSSARRGDFCAQHALGWAWSRNNRGLRRWATDDARAAHRLCARGDRLRLFASAGRRRLEFPGCSVHRLAHCWDAQPDDAATSGGRGPRLQGKG